ncbi:hybrid sensor histidine kinase/response regulator [Streptacidiphilus sp. ASG 303]|uniref:hybrid sensor histidine kinase/response regulator n=1 Tax=Streptacidiphilus sp. ASG 303 TaxID=2896847 RepID=UPI001E627C68|nr:hybrid sensor histidine kinase/response regulator [Streptacidiphilus sp. ASG 303]MCD0483696.1 hybrid sensor histidine kinase/response regulator [Streptacidiphilus sp. ASG 303]
MSDVAPDMRWRPVAALATEQDVFLLRRGGLVAAEALGLERQDQVRLATALSELGRDRLECTAVTTAFSVRGGAAATLVVTLRWQDGPPPSPESLASAARLVPRIRHVPAGQGGSIAVEQDLPAGADPHGAWADRVRAMLGPTAGDTLSAGMRAQTHDLIAALEDVRAQREELHLLNQELEETNQGVLALYNELSQELEETNSGVVALYAELEDKTRRLQEVSEAKTRFWATVSHELRSPINSVIGLARLLLAPGSRPLDADQRQQVSLIAGSGSTLLALVDELLDVAKAESGQLRPQQAPVDLGVLLGQLQGTMRPSSPGGRVRLSVAGPAGVPEPVTDEVMLTRILRNLLSNALKFTEAGEVSLDVGTESAGGREWMLFTVRDTGVGIPHDQQERVFEEFYQVQGPHQRGRSGTGLGLPYARRLTELLGGTLALTSEPGRGTTVVVRLPVRPEPEAPAGPAPADGPVPAAEPAGAGPADGPRPLGVLLCVDDDPAFRAVVRPVLERLADRVVELDRATGIAEAVRREGADAVLLDLQMPGTDGYAAARELAGAGPEVGGVPLVVVTAAPDDAVDRDRLAHARAVLRKGGLTYERLAEVLLGGPSGAGTGPTGTGRTGTEQAGGGAGGRGGKEAQ